jgi:antitoxin VapB
MSMPSIASRFRSRQRQVLRSSAKLTPRCIVVRVKRVDCVLRFHSHTKPDQDIGRWLQAFYAQAEPLQEQFLAERDDAPPQVRDWI